MTTRTKLITAILDLTNTYTGAGIISVDTNNLGMNIGTSLFSQAGYFKVTYPNIEMRSQTSTILISQSIVLNTTNQLSINASGYGTVWNCGGGSGIQISDNGSACGTFSIDLKAGGTINLRNSITVFGDSIVIANHDYVGGADKQYIKFNVVNGIDINSAIGTINLTAGSSSNIKANSDIEFTNENNGPILKTRGGTQKWRIFINDDIGTLAVEAI